MVKVSAVAATCICEPELPFKLTNEGIASCVAGEEGMHLHTYPY